MPDSHEGTGKIDGDKLAELRKRAVFGYVPTPDEIRTLRESIGLTLSEFARLLGLRGKQSQSMTCRLENGERKPKGPLLTLLVRYIRIPPTKHERQAAIDCYLTEELYKEDKTKILKKVVAKFKAGGIVLPEAEDKDKGGQDHEKDPGRDRPE